MTLINPYDDKKGDKTLSEGETPSIDLHHTPIVRSKLLELQTDSASAYDDKQGELIEFVSDGLFAGAVDIQSTIFDKDSYIVVAFRGTDSAYDAIQDLSTRAVLLSTYFKFITIEQDLYAHSGFVYTISKIYDKVKQRVLSSKKEFDLSGHSYGGGLSTLFAYIYYCDTGNKPRYFYNFGSPRVFVDHKLYRITKFNDNIDLIRVANDNDIISYYPHTGGVVNIAKHSLATAVLTTAFLGAGTSAILGGLAVGTALGYAGGGYTHVGTGIILFETKGNYIELGGGGEQFLSSNYYIIPKGTDLLRDPLVLDSTIVNSLRNIVMSSLSIGSVYRFVAGKIGFDSSVADIAMSESVLQAVSNAFNLNYRGKIYESMITKLQASRKLSFTGKGSMFFNKNSKFWTTAYDYLADEIIDLEFLGYGPAVKTTIRSDFITAITKLKETFSNNYPDLPNNPYFKQIKTIFSPEDIQEYKKTLKFLVEESMNAQLSLDTQRLKELFKIGLVLNSVKLITTGYFLNHLLTKAVGHYNTTYHRRLLDLPKTIYEGFSDKDEIKSGGNTYKKIKDNVFQDENGINFTLNHIGESTTLNQIHHKILGYYLYKDDADLNKLVVF
ncbi:MAG: hypothetical protein CMJ25_21820 [Phycisphaerae bacterium]|nr:hypothetical protein [Phycisphaerae bacterium]|tara:strand:+ start:9760 stop:11592 length:1833 start_codon:yes stop_codon:yes gene_type:complete